MPDGRYVVSAGGFSGNPRLGRDHRREVCEIGDFANRFQAIALSPDGKTLATIESAGGLKLRDFATGREQRQWHVTKNEYYQHLAFSPDGRFVAAGASRFDEATKKEEKFINVWDTAASTDCACAARGQLAVFERPQVFSRRPDTGHGEQ